MKRVISVVPVIVLVLLITACGSGKCFMCNQSGFFRKTIAVAEIETKICNDCYKTYRKAMDSLQDAAVDGFIDGATILLLSSLMKVENIL